MKKITFSLYAITIVVLFILTSCKDNSGTYSELYFLESDMNSALVSTVTISKDTACKKTLVADFYMNHSAYKLPFPKSLTYIKDSLKTNSIYTTLLDSFEIQINRTAGLISENIQAAINSSLTNYSFSNPYDIITTNSSAPATTYFRTTSENNISNSIENMVASKLKNQGAITSWDSIIHIYQKNHPDYIYFNLPKYVSQQAVAATFSLTEAEENLIRTDSLHRTVNIIQEVYRILD